MSDLSKKPNVIPNTIVDLLVSDILRKNNVRAEEVKKNLTDEQKKAIKELVQDLSKQVDAFVNTNIKSQKRSDSNK